MSAGKTKLTNQLKLLHSSQILLRFGIGSLAGLIIIQMLNFGWTLVSLFLVFVILLMVSLDSYKAWITLLAASMVSGFKYTISGFYGGISIRADQVALIILIAGLVLALLVGKVRLRQVPLLLPVVLYVGANFLSSALYAPEKGASYQGSLLLGVYVLMYIMTVTVLQAHPDKMKTAVRVLLILGVFQGLYALTAFIANKAGINLGGVNDRQLENAISLQGGFEEPNLLGAFEAAVGLMFLAFLTGKERGIRTGVAVSGLLLVLVVLGLTFTRAAWLGFMVGLVFILFLQKPERNIFNPRAAAVATALAAAMAIVIMPFVDTLTSGAISQRASDLLNFGSSSGEGRVQVQKVAIERWQKAELLGNGTLSLPPELASPSPAGGWLYSSVVQALHDTGIIGLVLLLWFQTGVLLIVMRGYRRAKDPFFKSSLAGFAAASVALFIASQASSFLWLGFPWIFSGIAVATALIASCETNGPTRRPARSA
jgi:hypothetical protein